MKNWKKTVLILLAFVLGTLIFALLIKYQDVGSLSFFLIDPENYVIVGRFAPYYFYWASLIFLLLLFVFILVVIFMPAKKASFVFEQGTGKLIISETAISGLVRTQLLKVKLFNDAKIRVKMSKKKIKITIVGSVIETHEVVETFSKMTDDIEQYMKNFIGINVPVQVEVHFKNSSKKEETAKKRVV